MHINYKWECMIGSIVFSRSRLADWIGMGLDDLLSIARVAAVKAESTWDPEDGRSLSSWVYLKAQYAVRSAIRRQFMYHSRHQGQPGRCASKDPGIEAVVVIRSSLGHLQAKLPNLDWAVLWLTHAEGRSSSEIAADYDMTELAVRKRLSRARKKAVTILSGKGIDRIGVG